MRLTPEQVTRATELELTPEQFINTLRANTRDTIITNQINDLKTWMNNFK